MSLQVPTGTSYGSYFVQWRINAICYRAAATLTAPADAWVHICVIAETFSAFPGAIPLWARRPPHCATKTTPLWLLTGSRTATPRRGVRTIQWSAIASDSGAPATGRQLPASPASTALSTLASIRYVPFYYTINLLILFLARSWLYGSVPSFVIFPTQFLTVVRSTVTVTYFRYFRYVQYCI